MLYWVTIMMPGFLVLSIHYLFLDRYVILGNHHDSWVFRSIDPLSIFVDRYVILGNHHDAWVFGSIDSLSIFRSLCYIG